MHYRVEDDELGSALWRRRDAVPDEVPDGGGYAEPISDTVEVYANTFRAAREVLRL